MYVGIVHQYIFLEYKYLDSPKKYKDVGLFTQSLFCNVENTNIMSIIFYLLGTVDILFPSNHNIHKSLCSLCFWGSDPLIDEFY